MNISRVVLISPFKNEQQQQKNLFFSYGYSNLRNISSLISGVGIFFFGTGLSLYHGFQGFLDPQPLTSLNWVHFTFACVSLSLHITLLFVCLSSFVSPHHSIENIVF